MDRDTRRAAEAWLQAGCRAVVIEVLDTQGSAPRRAGARMLVSAGQSLGTIGGGHLEWQAIATARELLSGAGPATLPRSERFALGPALGQCCGGAVTLGWKALDGATLAAWPEAAPRAHLQLYGAGHVGQAIARLLAPLDLSVDWIDEREAMFAAAAPPGGDWPAHIRRIAVDAVEAEVDSAPPGAHYLVLTHRHDLDLRITEAIVRRGDFASLGLIGSNTKRARFVHRLEARGLSAGDIQRIVCPIGIEGIAGKEPEVIAVSAVAQLLRHAG